MKQIRTHNKDIFGYISINCIQPFEAANIWAAFFMRRTTIKHNSCHKLLNEFQDDISGVFDMYPSMWDLDFRIQFEVI